MFVIAVDPKKKAVINFFFFFFFLVNRLTGTTVYTLILRLGISVLTNFAGQGNGYDVTWLGAGGRICNSNKDFCS